jgi:hypothetical protein
MKNNIKETENSTVKYSNGKVIVDTTDSIDMTVPHGNYKVYSCVMLKSMYKQQ